MRRLEVIRNSMYERWFIMKKLSCSIVMVLIVVTLSSLFAEENISENNSLLDDHMNRLRQSKLRR